MKPDMLVLTFVNIEECNGVADYSVRASVNGRVIWAGLVHSHIRSEGWPALVRRLVTQELQNGGFATPSAPRRKRGKKSSPLGHSG